MGIQTIQDIAENRKTGIPKNQTTQKDLTTGTNVESVPASIFKQQDIYKYMELSKLTEQDWYKRFENAKVLSSQEIKFKKSFERYCENFEMIKEKGLGIVMIGNPGAGKTFYTNCIMNALNSKYLVYRTSLSALLEEIRESYKNRNEEDDGFCLKDFQKLN